MTQTNESSLCCSSCTTPLYGQYCHHCGQRRQSDQLTMREMWRDLRARVLDWEQGFFRTIWHLLTQPQGMLQRVLAGQRKGYNHPVTFLLVCATISLLAAQLYDEAFWQFFRESMLKTLQKEEQSGFGPAEVERFVGVYAATMAILPYWMLLFSLPTAFFMRWLFPKRDHTAAEYWLLNLYTVGVALLIDAVVCTLVTVMAWDPQFQFRQLSVGLWMLLLTAYVGRAWLGGGLWTVLRLLAANVLAALVNGVLQLMLANGYARWGDLFVR